MLTQVEEDEVLVVMGAVDKGSEFFVLDAIDEPFEPEELMLELVGLENFQIQEQLIRGITYKDQPLRREQGRVTGKNMLAPPALFQKRRRTRHVRLHFRGYGRIAGPRMRPGAPLPCPLFFAAVQNPNTFLQNAGEQSGGLPARVVFMRLKPSLQLYFCSQHVQKLLDPIRMGRPGRRRDQVLRGNGV